MQRRRSIVVGAILIVLGIWALLSSLNVAWLRTDQLWPAILMAGGVAALYNALSTRPAKPDGIWLGTTALLCGGVFLYITLGAGQWSDLSTSWPVFPAIAGLAWAVSWLADTRQVSNLVTGLVALCVGALGFLYTSGRLEAARGVAIAQLWPVILVVLGAGLIVQYLVQRKR